MAINLDDPRFNETIHTVYGPMRWYRDSHNLRQLRAGPNDEGRHVAAVLGDGDVYVFRSPDSDSTVKSVGNLTTDEAFRFIMDTLRDNNLLADTTQPPDATEQPAPERQWSEWAAPDFATAAGLWATNGSTRVLLYDDGSWGHLDGGAGPAYGVAFAKQSKERDDWRPSYYRYAQANNLPLPPPEWYAPPRPETERDDTTRCPLQRTPDDAVWTTTGSGTAALNGTLPIQPTPHETTLTHLREQCAALFLAGRDDDARILRDAVAVLTGTERPAVEQSATPDDEGWVEHDGEGGPEGLRYDDWVRARLRNGEEHESKAGYYDWPGSGDDTITHWRRTNRSDA